MKATRTHHGKLDEACGRTGCQEHYLQSTGHYLQSTGHYLIPTDHYLISTDHYLISTDLCLLPEKKNKEN
jgi:hypothetical protein